MYLIYFGYYSTVFYEHRYVNVCVHNCKHREIIKVFSWFSKIRYSEKEYYYKGSLKDHPFQMALSFRIPFTDSRYKVKVRKHYSNG